MLGETGNRFGDDVEVLCRMEWYGCPRSCAKTMRPHAGGVDDDVSTNIPLCCADTYSSTVFDNDFVDFQILENAGPAALRGFCKSLRGIDRIGLAVLGKVDRSHNIVRCHERPHFSGTLRCYDIDFK